MAVSKVAASAGLMTIKHVVDRLCGAYPSITASKIRFLEDQGLISPARSSSGYRLYRDEDIARIEAILRMQKEHYYPLNVIKAKLKAGDEGKKIEELSDASSKIDLSALAHQKHTLESIPHLLGVQTSFVRSLADCGLIAMSASPKGRTLINGSDLPLIQAAAALDQYGIDPRHLRVYIQSVNRECLMFDQVLSSVSGKNQADISEEARQATIQTFEHLNKLTSTIRTALLKRELFSHFQC